MSSTTDDNSIVIDSAQEIRDELVSSLPVGWRQRLSLGVAIAHQPRLLFLDEPTSGVDPTARRVFWDLIYQLVDEGITIFVTTHYMDEAEYCQKIGIMRTGKLLAMDAPHILRGEKFAGLAWNIQLKDTLGALNVLENTPGVQRVGLAADNIRAITDRKIKKPQLQKALDDKGYQEILIEASDPNLEDVFLSLAKQ